MKYFPLLLCLLIASRCNAVEEIPREFQLEFKRVLWYTKNKITGVEGWHAGEHGDEKFPERCGRLQRDSLTHRNKVFKVKAWKQFKDGIEIHTKEGVRCRITNLNNGYYQVDWEDLPDFDIGYSFRIRP